MDNIDNVTSVKKCDFVLSFICNYLGLLQLSSGKKYHTHHYNKKQYLLTYFKLTTINDATNVNLIRQCNISTELAALFVLPKTLHNFF